MGNKGPAALVVDVGQGLARGGSESIAVRRDPQRQEVPTIGADFLADDQQDIAVPSRAWSLLGADRVVVGENQKVDAGFRPEAQRPKQARTRRFEAPRRPRTG